MGNTALAKLPSKMQVGLFLSDFVGHASVHVLVGRATVTGG